MRPLRTNSCARHGDQTDGEGVESKLSGTSVAFPAPNERTSIARDMRRREFIVGMHRYLRWRFVICSLCYYDIQYDCINVDIHL